MTLSNAAAALLACEKNGTAPSYLAQDPGDSKDINQSIGATIHYESRGGNVFVVSDLHLAAGKGPDGRYDGCENFFSDDAFRRFLQSAHDTSQRGVAHTLIINGDFVDFLRVTYVPGRPKGPSRKERMLMQLKIRTRNKRVRAMSAGEAVKFADDFEEWREMLLRIGVDMSVETLMDSVTDKEELYGLKTHDFKSVLRLDVVIGGHPEFFEGLADWLASGNRLMVVKGNHDLEWFWPAVRNYLRLDLAERLAQRGDGDVHAALLATVLPNITFADHAIVIDGDFFVEHGHPYDRLTRVLGGNTVNEGQELNIPIGSFFNRYMLNFVELDYPYLDNVRPTPNMLPMIIRQNGFAGIRLLFDHLIVMVKTIRRRYFKYIFGQDFLWRILALVAAIIVPLAAMAAFQIAKRPTLVIALLEWLATFLVIHFLIQGIANWQLEEPDSLADFAVVRFNENPAYRLITFGHTHNPDQFERAGKWFYNTGTWIPVVETSTAEIRTDNTFTFLRLDYRGGALQPAVLLRWDDEAGRPEPMTLIRRRSLNVDK